MLNLKDIKSFFTTTEGHDTDILKEYLQCKILEIIYSSKIGGKLIFIGGTSIRIIYNIQRFSEDLDFDNFNLTKREFEETSETVKKELEKEGCKIEIETLSKDKTFHYYIKIPDILFENALTPHKNQKILIKVDTEPQGFIYKPEQKLLNKFDIFTHINVAPLDILLSMKFNAVFNRKRTQGRDFYDIVFLTSRSKPNYDFLKEKLNIKNRNELKEKILHKCKELDFKKLVKDIEPLIFNSKDLKKVLYFEDFIKSSEF